MKEKSKVIPIHTRKKDINIDKENFTIQIKNVKYKINKEVLKDTVKRVWLNKPYYKELNTMDEIVDFLEAKGLIIEEFLEYISDFWEILP